MTEPRLDKYISAVVKEL